MKKDFACSRWIRKNQGEGCATTKTIRKNWERETWRAWKDTNTIVDMKFQVEDNTKLNEDLSSQLKEKDTICQSREAETIFLKD